MDYDQIKMIQIETDRAVDYEQIKIWYQEIHG